ncbi:hypothetical protein BV22DRAFT_1066618 [Leucogyrophana mollusca]|uniref:Uncharacterized protein n=1 Tax=Leucogyrophana mollusca TaxID=85980 RepID=A0ACB8BG95_9AGAM|nr:hypothetical protein BV22DRAFT_1066618 [Leucogyrophana mollusca]
MSYSTVVCLVSGCCPEAADILPNVFEIEDFDVDGNGPDEGSVDEDVVGDPGPLVIEALNTLADEHEKAGERDIVVIGVPNTPRFTSHSTRVEVPNRDSALYIPDSALTIISNCVIGDWWDGGYVDAPPPNSEDVHYCVSFGVCVMVQSTSLDILAMATHGRMTPQRVWRLAMHQGWSDPHNEYALKGVDYGDVELGWKKYPAPLPWLSHKEIIAMEKLGSVKEIQRALIWRAKFWVWMRPDRFPLEEFAPDDAPAHVEGPSANHDISRPNSRAMIYQIPFELLSNIASKLSLPSLLALASTARHLRAKLLSHPSDRDTLARAWIRTSAPWYLLPPSATEGGQTYQGSLSQHLGWAYLHRCFESGSMRNRRRIWEIALQIELLADNAGI